MSTLFLTLVTSLGVKRHRLASFRCFSQFKKIYTIQNISLQSRVALIFLLRLNESKTVLLKILWYLLISSIPSNKSSVFSKLYCQILLPQDLCTGCSFCPNHPVPLLNCVSHSSSLKSSIILLKNYFTLPSSARYHLSSHRSLCFSLIR